MVQSNFDKVVEFNKCFGVHVPPTGEYLNLKDNPDLVKLRSSLITEEVGELLDAIKDNDFTEVIDALSDILYVVYGAGASFGIDLDKTFDIVHRSNMSKLCISEEQAKRTVDWYVANDTRYDSPSFRKGDGLYNGKPFWVVFNQSTGKILKSIDYTPAKFDQL